MNVKDTASQSTVVFETRHTTEKTIVGVHVSPGSAVRRGGITNHRSIVYSLSNISAKNHQDQLMRHSVHHTLAEQTDLWNRLSNTKHKQQHVPTPLTLQQSSGNVTSRMWPHVFSNFNVRPSTSICRVPSTISSKNTHCCTEKQETKIFLTYTKSSMTG